MKRLLAILTVVFIFSVTPAFGDPGDEHRNNIEGGGGIHGEEEGNLSRSTVQHRNEDENKGSPKDDDNVTGKGSSSSSNNQDKKGNER